MAMTYAKIEEAVKECSVEGCDKKYVSRGYCQKHYDAYRRYNNPLKSKWYP